MTEALRITVDTDDLQANVDSLAEFLGLVLDIRHGLIDLFDAPSHVLRVRVDRLPVSGAGELRAALQPTQAFDDLVTAIRAGTVQLRAIKDAVHGASPSSQPTATSPLGTP